MDPPLSLPPPPLSLIRHRCDGVQSPPRCHPHRVRPPPAAHAGSVAEDLRHADHHADQKPRRRRSDQHLLRRGREPGQRQRPLLQARAVKPRRRTLMSSCVQLSVDCARFVLYGFRL